MANLQKRIVEVPSKATVTVNIPHVPVNYFRIQNSSPVTVYCGLSHMPTKNLFEFKVPAGEARLYCEEKTYSHIYIYNDGTETATLILYTFTAQFEPTALAMTDIGGTGDSEDTYLGEVDVTGFRESLPTGNNHIGQVTTTNDYTPKLEEIISAMGSGGTSAFDDVNVRAFVIHMVNLRKQYACHFKHGDATGGVKMFNGGNSQNYVEIDYITNDGEEDLEIIVATTGVGANDIDYSDNYTYSILKSGETMNKIFISARAIFVRGNTNYRCTYRYTTRP